MGLVDPEGTGYEEYVDHRPREGIYRKVVVKDDRLAGLLFVGEIQNAGVIGDLIRRRADVWRIKRDLLSPTFGYAEVEEVCGSLAGTGGVVTAG